MSTYVIGDIQGCYQALQNLLALVEFKPETDRLWTCGDLVNRGPESLAVLHFFKALSPAPIIVLGNHDLHLLAVAAGTRQAGSKDTLNDIFSASDAEQLCDWLRYLPLMHHDPQTHFTLVHAGLAPQWTLQQAQSLAREVEAVLQGPDYIQLLQNMFGDTPASWSDDLTGWPRLRFIINAMTRIRFCTPQGELDLNFKGPPGAQPSSLLPWFELPERKTQQNPILFGHWAALNGQTTVENIYALDTGCVWGNQLTALRLEDKQRFSVKN